MVAGPIGTYYLTLNIVFRGELFQHVCTGSATKDPPAILSGIGSSTMAGATAAIMANVVLVAYVIVAMKEDQSERLAEEEKTKKGE